MANANTTGFGLRMIERVGNTPATSGQSEYPVKSALGVGIYKGNPVSFQDGSGDEGYIQDMSFATTDDTGAGGQSYNNTTQPLLVGVFNGIFYVDSTTKKPRWANSVDAGTTFGTDYNTGSADGTAFVNDDPTQEYMIKTDAAAPISHNGKNYNVTNFTASDNRDGQSIVKLHSSGGHQAYHMWKIVRVANVPDNLDRSAANCDMVVAYNPTSNIYLD
tara:strand:+ start:2722 stop:3375 length:654 start_codon:yes stop_codon:yes gene_type:complete